MHVLNFSLVSDFYIRLIIVKAAWRAIKILAMVADY